MPATIKIRWAVIRRIAGARDSDAEHGLHRVPRDRHEAVDLRFVDDQRRREEDRVAGRGMRAGHGPHARDDTALGHLLLDARPDLLVEREAALARPVLDQLDKRSFTLDKKIGPLRLLGLSSTSSTAARRPLPPRMSP